MPASDDLEVIRALLRGDPPSQEVNDYVKGRLTDVIAAAHTHPGGGRPARASRHWPGPAAGAARGHRRLALRVAGGAAGVLAAAAVALAAVVVPSAGGHGTVGPAVTTADVMQRVDSALSAAGPGALARMTVITRASALPGGTTTTTSATEWSYDDRWRSVTTSPAGQPAYDEGLSAGSYTLVVYAARAWARHHEQGSPVPRALGPRGCRRAAAALPLLFLAGPPAPGAPGGAPPAAVAGDLRAAISCGSLTMAGRQRVNGAETIKLTSGPTSPIAETLWVSPGNYLPVRVLTRTALGPRVLRQTADITWLAPTPQNLAKLTVPIPTAFRHVPLSPLLHHIPGERPQKVTTAP
jgi:hypothetical protein